MAQLRLRRHLRWIRAAVALAFLAPAALMFVDFGRFLPAWAAALVARVQLVPALVALMALPAVGAALSVGVVAAVTLATGRVYCSTVCPLGTLQDALIRIGDRRHRRGRYRFRFQRPPAALHLGLAAAAGALALAGILAPLDLLEPYSSFGRMLSALLRPAVAAAVDVLSRALAVFHVYAVQPVPLPSTPWPAAVVALAWLAGIAALALARGRLFCNLLCPAGAVLRLLARGSAFRLAVDEAACNGCGVCEKACKAGCIDAERRVLDFDACVGCFDCLDACPREGIRFEARWRGRPAEEAEESEPGRRAVLKGAVLAPAALLVPAAAAAVGATGDPRDARAPITPPGSRTLRHFTSRCTACHLCVAQCPSQVLRPSLLEYGLSGLLQPRLVYDGAACVYDCNRCGEVCPTGAIAALPLPEKRLVQVGRARFVKADCVVETTRKVCGACAEHCPTKAIAMVPYLGDAVLRIPEVNEEACIGCGACEHPCPVRPRKAIYVEARPVHGTARRIEQAPPPAPAAGDDFPF